MGYTQAQLWTLLARQAIVSFAFESIFPFVNQMLLEIGVVDDPKDVGYWSGLVESVYAVFQLVTIFPSTWLADIYGRKPVIVWSAVMMAISMGSFGVSTSYTQMILSRILGGVHGGSNTVLRVMASEMAAKETEADVFSLLGMAYRTGQILGQPIGGALSHPERRFPALFDSPFWTSYPFALPCFVGAAYALVSAILCQLILPETLQSKASVRNANFSVLAVNSDETAPLLSDDTLRSLSTVQKTTPSPTVWSLLTWPLASLLLSVFGMVLITEGFFAMYPLFCFSPVELGGLGLSEAQIGFQMAARSLFALLSIVPFRRFTKRFGALNVYRFSIFCWIPTIILCPFLNGIAKMGGEGGLLWYMILFLMWTVWSVTGWAWIATFVISSSLSPYPEAVATIQGMVSTAIIAPQAFAPALGTSSFALAIKYQAILGGNLFWVGTCIFGALVYLHSLTLRDSSHDWRAIDPNDVPEEARI